MLLLGKGFSMNGGGHKRSQKSDASHLIHFMGFCDGCDFLKRKNFMGNGNGLVGGRFDIKKGYG